jgi:glycosyltransferase involved in cell wall biosynthesis
VNNNPLISGVMIQHEYGIYGGVDGENILSFMELCKKPILVTLHTVLPDPSENMKRVTQRIIEEANKLVVLTENSKKILELVYPESKDKVHVIPHGVHAAPFTKTAKAKKKLELEDLTILSTFGLLSRGKGIEYVIKSLPEIVKKYPTVTYLILGQTHPVVRRNEGESYRQELIDLVSDLNLKDHVMFYDQYLSLSDLIEFLQATDIYISTSINPNQAVSGTLSYALGTGRVVVSTEFAQAKEIITKENGRLVPIKNEKAYADTLLELLSPHINLHKMNLNAYEGTRKMLWSNVACEYSKLLRQNILPPINLTHLKTMTDDFGLFQFAKYDVPDTKFGYTLDDNARALVLSLTLFQTGNMKNTDIIEIYLHFLGACQLPGGSFINYIDYHHKKATIQNTSEDLEDATARAMWALSEVIQSPNISQVIKDTAQAIFIKGMSHCGSLTHIRANALMIKAYSNMLNTKPKNRTFYKDSIIKNANYLVDQLEEHSIKEWQWFDSYLGYNNGIIPEALLVAGDTLKSDTYKEKGIVSLKFLIEKTFSSNRYMPIGHSHWYTNNEKRSNYDQQPEDPASMILALATAYDITHDEAYRKLMIICFSWFLGNNSLQIPLYNYENGGCFDGLHPDRINMNEGAESLVSYLMSRVIVSQLYT